MASPAARDELPLVIVRDVSTWLGMTFVCIAAAVYLGWSFSSGQEFDDLEFIACGVLLLCPVFALLGSREIRLYSGELVVIHRGRVRLERSLDDLVALRSIPFTDIHWAVFGAPTARVVLFSNTPKWRRIVEHCHARLRR